MKHLTILMALAFTLSLTAAQTAPQNQDSLQKFKQKYNAQTEQVPKFLGKIVGGETLNIQIQGENNTRKLGIEFKNVRIKEIKRGELENPSLEVNVSQTAIRNIEESEKPYKELRNQMNEKEITYETKKVSTSIKFTIVNNISRIASALGF